MKRMRSTMEDQVGGLVRRHDATPSRRPGHQGEANVAYPLRPAASGQATIRVSPAVAAEATRVA